MLHLNDIAADGAGLSRYQWAEKGDEDGSSSCSGENAAGGRRIILSWHRHMVLWQKGKSVLFHMHSGEGTSPSAPGRHSGPDCQRSAGTEGS